MYIIHTQTHREATLTLAIHLSYLEAIKQNSCFPWWLSGKESACQCQRHRFIPGLQRSPGEGNYSPLQYSCLENLMDRRNWRAAVHGVTKSQTRLKQLSTHTQEMPLSPTWTEFRKKRYNFTIKALLFIFKNRPVHSHVCVVSWRAYHPASPDHRVFPSNSASINTDYHQQEATF